MSNTITRQLVTSAALRTMRSRRIGAIVAAAALVTAAGSAAPASASTSIDKGTIQCADLHPAGWAMAFSEPDWIEEASVPLECVMARGTGTPGIFSAGLGWNGSFQTPMVDRSAWY